jgi:ABC-type transport system involved in cytochrome bd biosynthesis fused ATPase/permease subunit
MAFLDDTDDAAMLRALERVGLSGALEAKRPKDPLGVVVDELSAGSRQRVALARVLLRTPAICLLDEPDTNLDRRGTEFAVSLLRDLSKDALVIVAAHTQELLDAADRVIHLEDGRIVSDIQRSTTDGQSPVTGA